MFNKKVLVIIFIIILLSILFFFFQSLSAPKKGPSTRQIEPTIIPTIVISNVGVKNIYKTYKQINKQGDLLMSQTPDHTIMYLSKFNLFIIDIKSSNFLKAREEAEKKFIELLGVNKIDVCKLDVDVNTSYRINPEYASRKMNLSFCE